ncbi:uncharacterized protein LOC108102485 [Drosophila eugracilis]|uniref:uncharacterized protein LOC108102485 n=1 Tax=Drosophila eugracilis TaxID=29029 RepID=UPI0007E6D499|nr:uncharacterized protein LOC108102485 [Drosophila eugracilis]
MDRLKWITLLQILIICSAFQLAQLNVIPDWVKQRFLKAMSSTGNTVKAGSMSLESLGKAISNVKSIPKGLAQIVSDLLGFSESQKDSPSSDPSCAKDDMMCHIKGVFGSSTEHPV